MKCPRCETPTTVREVGDAKLDVCTTCQGMFLDRGELNKVAVPTDGDLEYATVDLDSFDHADRFGPTTCPRCESERMKKVEFNIHTHIVLDFCERCQGFWLDGRELDRINDEVRRLNEAARQVADPPMLWFAKFIWTLPR